MVYCSKCGSENPDGSAYCYKCGTKLIVEEVDRKGITKPNITGKYPLPRPDPTIERPRYQDIYPDERALMNEAVRPPDDGDFSTLPKGYELRPVKQRNNTAIIAVAVIIGCVIIAAAVLIVFVGGNTSGTGSRTYGEIRNGDYSDYKITYDTGTQIYTGTCRISYSNITDTTMTMTFQTTVNGQTTTQSIDYNVNGNTWEPDSIDTSGSSFEIIGTETIQTALGSKECTHTRSTMATFVEDDWFTSSGCYLKSKVVYTNGVELTMEITETNIRDV